MFDPTNNWIRRKPADDQPPSDPKRSRTKEPMEVERVERVQVVANFSLVASPTHYLLTDHIRLVGAYLPTKLAIKLGCFPLITGSISHDKDFSLFNNYLQGSYRLRQYIAAEGRWLTRYWVNASHYTKPNPLFYKNLLNLQVLFLKAKLDNSALRVITDQIPGLVDLRTTESTIDGEFVKAMNVLTNLQRLTVKKPTLAEGCLTSFSLLESLWLCETPLTPQLLIEIGSLTQLRSLALTQMGLDDSQLELLSSCRNLVKLDLAGNVILGSGLSHLSSQLQKLWLQEAPIQVENCLTRFRQLRALFLTHVNLTEQLISLPNLTELSQVESVYHADDMTRLAMLTKLQFLDLTYSYFDESCISKISCLKKLTCLQELRLEGMAVGEAAELNRRDTEALTSNLLQIETLRKLGLSVGIWNDPIKFNILSLSTRVSYLFLELVRVEVYFPTAQSIAQFTSLKTLILKDCDVSHEAMAILPHVNVQMINEEDPEVG